MDEAPSSGWDDDDTEHEDWGASRGYFPEDRTPVSRWPAPPDSIAAPAPPGPAGRDGAPAGDLPGSHGKLTAVLAALRGRRRRS
jgi:hypothetical protein